MARRSLMKRQPTVCGFSRTAGGSTLSDDAASSRSGQSGSGGDKNDRRPAFAAKVHQRFGCCPRRADRVEGNADQFFRLRHVRLAVGLFPFVQPAPVTKSSSASGRMVWASAFGSRMANHRGAFAGVRADSRHVSTLGRARAAFRTRSGCRGSTRMNQAVAPRVSVASMPGGNTRIDGRLPPAFGHPVTWVSARPPRRCATPGSTAPNATSPERHSVAWADLQLASAAAASDA